MEFCNTCTFATTGEVHQIQEWATCYDCFNDINLGACMYCLNNCHKGHRIGITQKSEFFCDCGANLCQSCVVKENNVITHIPDHPTTKTFKLNFTKKPNPGLENIRIVEGVHQWIENIFHAKSKRRQKCSINKSDVTILSNSILSNNMNYSHQGLIQYVFLCWAKELGVVLKPDMLFFAIISEIKNFIVDKPEPFRSLFTKENEKTDIVIVDLTIEKLMTVLENLMPSKELFDIVTNTTFETAPEHFLQVMGITMADMGTPYYDYYTTRCGIPEVKVMGCEEDWLKLIQRITQLSTLLSSYHWGLKDYFKRITKTLTELVTAINVENIAFFENIFSYEMDKNYCQSGHQYVLMNGWIKNFYIKNHSSYINDYASHLSCLPYSDEDKYYFYISGMTSSRLQDGYLYPEYNIAHCQLIHPNAEAIFKLISQKK
jgi:hypothetical protein